MKRSILYAEQIQGFELTSVLPEELPESFWIALSFTLIVAMIGIIYTILQGIISLITTQLPTESYLGHIWANWKVCRICSLLA